MALFGTVLVIINHNQDDESKEMGVGVFPTNARAHFFLSLHKKGFILWRKAIAIAAIATTKTTTKNIKFQSISIDDEMTG